MRVYRITTNFVHDGTRYIKGDIFIENNSMAILIIGDTELLNLRNNDVLLFKIGLNSEEIKETL